jgi:hypothetical protein
MRSRILQLVVVVLVQLVRALVATRLSLLLAERFRLLVAVGSTLVLLCHQLRLLALQTLVMVLHIKPVNQAVFTLPQREAHRTALKLLLAVQ